MNAEQKRFFKLELEALRSNYRWSYPTIKEPSNVRRCRAIIRRFERSVSKIENRHRARVTRLIEKITREILFNDAKKALTMIDAFKKEMKSGAR